MADFLPRPDDSFDLWTAGFAREIAAPPGPARLGLTEAQVQAYAATQATFAAARLAAISPETRGPWNVARKDEAKAALSAQTRTLARQVRAHVGITAETLYRLGLGKRYPERPIDATERPQMELRGIEDDTLRLRLRPAHGDRIRLPAGTVGAAVYLHVGETIPQRDGDWELLGNTTRPRCAFRLPKDAGQPGESVWITARWLDRRLHPGAWATPTQTHLPMRPTLWMQRTRTAA